LLFGRQGIAGAAVLAEKTSNTTRPRSSDNESSPPSNRGKRKSDAGVPAFKPSRLSLLLARERLLKRSARSSHSLSQP